MASMIQQISNTRSNKQINTENLSFITHASCFNLFDTKSFGIMMKVCLFYVKKVGDDSYTYQAISFGTADPFGTNVDQLANVGATRTQNYSAMITKCPSLDRTDMFIENVGDEKLLIECFYHPSASYSKNKLGFIILSPEFGSISRYKSNRGNFAYRLVIIPKPGLFPVVSS